MGRTCPAQGSPIPHSAISLWVMETAVNALRGVHVGSRLATECNAELTEHLASPTPQKMLQLNSRSTSVLTMHR